MDNNEDFEKKKDPETEDKDTETRDQDDTSTKEEAEVKDDEEKKEKKYDLNEIPEYVALKADYDSAVQKCADLEEQNKQYELQIQELTNFKLKVERKEKEDMIKTFFMLSDEDKKDVVENIDKYSLDEIESKLSVICVRNRVDFKMFDEKQTEDNKPGMIYNLDSTTDGDDNTPAWVKAVRQNS